MALSFYFRLHAPASEPADDLERFFKALEKEAKKMGFQPTLVLNAKFDSPERREFSRRLTTGLEVQNELLKGVEIGEGQVFSHDHFNGHCRVIPTQGVFLIVTNEQQEETVFGLMRFPELLKDPKGRAILATGATADWSFRNFVDSPDPRFRKLMAKLQVAGFVKEVVDEYAPRENQSVTPSS